MSKAQNRSHRWVVVINHRTRMIEMKWLRTVVRRGQNIRGPFEMAFSVSEAAEFESYVSWLRRLLPEEEVEEIRRQVLEGEQKLAMLGDQLSLPISLPSADRRN